MISEYHEIHSNIAAPWHRRLNERTCILQYVDVHSLDITNEYTELLLYIYMFIYNSEPIWAYCVYMCILNFASVYALNMIIKLINRLRFRTRHPLYRIRTLYTSFSIVIFA